MKIPSPSLLPDVGAVLSLAPKLAEAAQAIYDAWEQDEHGMDEERGGGGICDRIADAFIPLLVDAGVESLGTIQAGCGPNHVYVVCLLQDGAYSVDIPPGTYETGGGYTWTKRPGIVLVPEDIQVDRIDGPMAPEAFEERYLD